MRMNNMSDHIHIAHSNHNYVDILCICIVNKNFSINNSYDSLLKHEEEHAFNSHYVVVCSFLLCEAMGSCCLCVA